MEQRETREQKSRRFDRSRFSRRYYANYYVVSRRIKTNSRSVPASLRIDAVNICSVFSFSYTRSSPPWLYITCAPSAPSSWFVYIRAKPEECKSIVLGREATRYSMTNTTPRTRIATKRP